MATKADFLKMAAEYEARAEADLVTARRLAAAGCGDIAKEVLDQRATSIEQARKWRMVAGMHHKTRSLYLKQMGGG